MYWFIILNEYPSKHSGEYKTIFLCTIYNTVICSLCLQDSGDGRVLSCYWYLKDGQLSLHSRASIFLQSTESMPNNGNQIILKTEFMNLKKRTYKSSAAHFN